MTDNLPAARRTVPVQDPTAEIAQLTAELTQLGAEAERLTGETESGHEPGTSLVPAAGGQAAEAKARMTQQHARLQHLQNDISSRSKRLQELMQAQMRAAHRALQPLRAQAARMEEGIAAISLYLGIEEGIQVLRDGEPAAADTPVTLRQLVLSADQECMVAAESGGLDIRSLDEFFAWMLADHKHLDQVLPEPKGIVALVPSRTERRYAQDPWFNAAMKEANAQTFFLVRNGERLFVVFNELTLKRRLFPAADEFANLFRDYRGRPLQPGSLQWKDAEEKANATRRHYMKVGLLLQGLVDRTTILHPHPEDGLNLLDQDAIDAGRVVLIPDAEDSYALGDGSERFADWQQRINTQLRPGMRVIVATKSEAFRDLSYGHSDYRSGHPRLHPTTAEAPDPATVYTIEQRRPDGGLIIRYERTDEVWRDGGPRPAKVRASCTVRAEDPFLLAYDEADPAQLRAFLRNRVDREHYVDMVPVINAAIAAKEEERTVEAPFRQMVVGMLMQKHAGSLAEAEVAAVGLVDWWKFANRVHRPLTGRGADADAKAARQITAEFERRQRTGHNRASQQVVDELADQHRDALLIAQTHSKRLVVLTPQSSPFVREYIYNLRGQQQECREWVLPGVRPNRWTVLRSTPAWVGWDRGATVSEHVTGPEREDLADKVAQLARTAFPDREIAAVTLQGTHDVIAWTVCSWGQFDEDHPATGKAETVVVQGYGFSWHRDPRRKAAVGESASFGRYDWDRHGDRHPWSASRAQSVKVLRLDADVVQKADRCHARYQTVARRRAEIRDTARTAYRTAETIWNERQEQAAYASFLDKYGEPSLWEGHRKTLTLPAMPQPADQNRYSSRLLGTSWLTALAALIEAGEDLADYTLGQALDAQGVEDVPAALHSLPLSRPA
ncbi:hypothetical protein OG800_49655 (plasmid) [Streptomyces sp. NBC_00445]|uniref:hypothetical protein n=1 Tax=Streptomyces sp. NBC_00445 TaxID=2975745 RepID=UPI002E1AFFCC